ncbi:ABC transporter permease [Nakamurella endophytica]|uniref:Peptide ABC transporter n=1 Tax=Nakamurella endophytica TaxID=1748367 RepID=A0A917SVK4_9ACTN|nr:ABC transporter permease [Nakamurella endophytica]GGL99711.1 peptide ABC transporter [Nakamurella endophytica]
MTARLAYVGRRILLTIPVLIATSIFVFLLIRLVPGDPVQTMLGIRATPDNVATVRAQLGLDKPLPEQYWTWITGVLHGDLGQDFISHEPITSLLGVSLPITLELTVLAMLLAVLVGVPLGVLAAVKGRWTRRISGGFVVAAISIPEFWLGIMLVLLFTGVLHLLPPNGWVPITQDVGLNITYMILPVLALALGQTAYLLRTTRAAMLGTAGEPYVAFLHAKGLRTRTVIYLHMLRNASGPIVTVAGIQFGVLLGGAIVVENLFALPGVGRMVVGAISNRNYVVVQGGVLVIATLFILVNLLTDIVHGLLDPRVEEAVAR